LKFREEDSHQLNTYGYLDLSVTYMFLTKGRTSLKTRVYEESSWDTIHNKKGYRVYNQQTKMVIISRDVEVDENASWNWEEEKVVKSNILVQVQ